MSWFNRKLEQINRIGLKETIRYLFQATLNELFFYRAYSCREVSCANLPASPNLDGEFREIHEPEALALARNPEADLDPDFLTHAFNKGDRCFGFFRDGKIAYYNFCAATATQVDSMLWFEFPEDGFYLYKGYTLPDSRGLGLSASSVWALRAFCGDKKDKRCFALFATHNVPSLRAFGKLGFSEIATFTVIGWGKRIFVFPSQAAKKRNLRIVVRADG